MAFGRYKGSGLKDNRQKFEADKMGGIFKEVETLPTTGGFF